MFAIMRGTLGSVSVRALGSALSAQRALPRPGATRSLLPVTLTIACVAALTSACKQPKPRADSEAAQAKATAAAKTATTATGATTGDHDPLAAARASIGQVKNREAVIPAQCYTQTDGLSNPCWTCHTKSTFPNDMSDWDLQREYAFSDAGMTNYWQNLFVDLSDDIATISDDEIRAYVREDNYQPLRAALAQADDYPGYRPDLDFAAGFDDEGFARDGSGWRAFRYKPFLGTFWPTNGSTDDVMIRLPEAFRRDPAGAPSQAAYRINLAIVEASLASDPQVATDAIRWPTEPLDERVAGIDLDGDGTIEAAATTLVGLPERYVGGAADVKVTRGLYPTKTEFLHSVRYIDPEAPSLIATRMKELRYSRKVRELDSWALLYAYDDEKNAKETGVLPQFSGSPLVGLQNSFGWQLQGFIEDRDGRLRLQTEEEHYFCMGCHSTIGVTADQTFALPRKVPGARGWRYQDLRGIPDVPQVGHSEPEILSYFRRVGGGDEFRANDEVLRRFFPDGKLDEAAVRVAAPGGGGDITTLLAPSPERAWQLNKAYRALVKRQAFERGRDAPLSPLVNVHQKIENGATDLEKRGKIFDDGRLQLDWRDAFSNRDAAEDS